MLHVAPHLARRHSTYYLRMKVPVDLLDHFSGKKEIKKSLKTSSLTLARKMLRVELGTLEKTFANLRITAQDVTFSPAPPVVDTPNGTLKQSEVTPKVTPVKAQEALEGGTLSTLVKQFMGDKSHSLGVKTRMEYDGTWKLVLSLLGRDLPLSSITRETARNLRERLSETPANASKGCTSPMSIASINKHIQRFSSLMRYAVKEGHLKENPASGLKIKQKNKKPYEERKAYSLEDLKKMVKALPSPEDGDRPERYFVPWIGLFSGLRLDEICSLYKEDVREIEGIWCFDVNENRPDKKLKTSSSKRIVPLHPQLIELGFLEYVKGCEARLWPNLSWREADGYGNGLGKWFQRMNRAEITSDPLKSFHSLRHTFTDSLKQSGVPEEITAALLGHKHEGITYGRYGKVYRPQVLLEAVQKIVFTL